MGAEVLRGDLNERDVLRAGALDSDGIIHLAFVVPSVSEAATRTDAKVIETFASSLAGSGKPLVISGGTLVTPGRPATERATNSSLSGPSQPASPTCRLHSQPQAGVSAPAWSCCPARCTARENVTASSPSSSPRPGRRVSPATAAMDQPLRPRSCEGRREPYRRAIDQAPAGAVLNAVGDEGVPVCKIAEAIGRT